MYTLLRPLGAGSFGAVYEASKAPLNKRVALKVLHPDRAMSGQAVQRFIHEAQAAAALKHLHIVEVDDLGVIDGVPYIAMEFLHGAPLSEMLAARGAPLSPAEAIDLLLPICSAVAVVHDAGMVHRDIKPDNIFLWEDRPQHHHPKLLDFGVAKLADGAAQMTGTGASLGTPLYMSPEQWRGSRHVKPASDQWALGVILFQCLSLQLPFYGEDLHELMFAVVNEQPRPLGRFNPGIDRALEEVILRALAKRPEDRHASVRAFACALIRWASVGAQERWRVEFGAAPSMVPLSLDATMEAARPLAPQGFGPAAGGALHLGGTAISDPGSLPVDTPGRSVEAPRPRRSIARIGAGAAGATALAGIALAIGLGGKSEAERAALVAPSSPTRDHPAPSTPPAEEAVMPASAPAASAREAEAATGPKDVPSPTVAPTAARQPEPPVDQPAAGARRSPPSPQARSERSARSRPPAPAPAAPAAAPSASSSGGGMARARQCMSSGGGQSEVNRCIVSALRNSASSETELRLLCVTYRSLGDRGNATSCMRRYIQRNPDTRHAAQFREYINE